MKIIHCSQRQYNQIATKQPYETIIRNISSQYPAFWNFIQDKRTSCEKMGLEMHKVSTRIERIIMTQLADVLTSEGHTHLIRVHDALWGIDDIPNPTEYLYGIITNYMMTFSRTDYNWYYPFDTHNRDTLCDAPIISSTLNTEFDTHNRDAIYNDNDIPSILNST